MIASSMCDANMKMRPSAFFQIFQDLATDAAETNGVGKSEVFDKGLLWIFVRVSVRFYDYPLYRDQVTLYTYPNKTRAIFYPRQAYMEDENGKILAKVHSLWALIKKEDRELYMTPLPNMHGFEKRDDELPSPKKVEAPSEGMTLLDERHIGYTDLDLNKHMNNVRYIEYILDLFPTSYFAEHPLKGIDINYIHEIHEGETLSLYANEEKTIVVGNVGEKLAFTSELLF